MKYCLHCFLPEEECCVHQFVEFPDKCVCDKGEWLSFKDEPFEVTPICQKYDGIKLKSGEWSNCQNCEHDKECHNDSHQD